MTAIFANNSKPQQSLKRDDGEFVVFEAVAFFKEHTNRDGVQIDRNALQRICDRCNERIRDTNDFPPVVLRHTTDEGDRDPEVVGFAGPFYLGTIGNVRPKAAILGQMRIFAFHICLLEVGGNLTISLGCVLVPIPNGLRDETGNGKLILKDGFALLCNVCGDAARKDSHGKDEAMPEGTIKKLTDRGFGFIKTGSDKDLFFHSSQVQGCRFDDLREGQKVSYSEGQGPKGPCAENVTPV